MTTAVVERIERDARTPFGYLSMEARRIVEDLLKGNQRASQAFCAGRVMTAFRLLGGVLESRISCRCGEVTVQYYLAAVVLPRMPKEYCA